MKNLEKDPVMIKRAPVHIAGWVALYLLWILVFQKRSVVFSRTATVQFCYLFFIAANYYFNIWFAIPKFLYQKKITSFVIVALAAIMAGALMRVPVAMYLNKTWFLVGKAQPGFAELFYNSFINIFIWVICLVAAKLVMDRARFQKYVHKIEKERSKAELDFLKAQFNPHFLFNSINSIYGHIDKGNTSARNMLLTFSDMLRYQLYECNTDSVSIDKELNYIRNYVALQQVRKGDNLVVELDIDENVRSFMIAPLLFIAFIENAFKYVSNDDKKENRIKISFRAENGSLLFQTYNTKGINNNKGIEHNGIGVMNARRRMELVYPGKHDLAIHEHESTYEVILKLQLS
ncbi:MAG: histidine kinase [Bacteroidota bacterium]|nr:histidine kinase [Bacteroidota bacterium]